MNTYGTLNCCITNETTNNKMGATATNSKATDMTNNKLFCVGTMQDLGLQASLWLPISTNHVFKKKTKAKHNI